MSSHSCSVTLKPVSLFQLDLIEGINFTAYEVPAGLVGSQLEVRDPINTLIQEKGAPCMY